MQGRVRNAISRLCSALNETFLPVFVSPSPLQYGQESEEGEAETFVRSDHAHALPSLPDDSLENFDDQILLVDDMFYRGIGQGFPYPTAGTITFGGQDEAGVQGALGSVSAQTATVANARAYIAIANDVSFNLNDTNHVVKRLQRFECRVRPVLIPSDRANIRVVIGFLRSTSVFNKTNFVDGLLFHLETDGAGAGNWTAMSIDTSTRTEKGTGVAPVVSGSYVGYQTFRIDLVEGQAQFFIDDFSTPVSIIGGNIPDAKVAGIVIGVENVLGGAGTEKTISLDYILYKGTRLYNT